MKPEVPAKGWFEHNYFRTYGIANHVADVAANPMDYISDLLQNLVANDGMVDFFPAWQKESALHRFSSFIADMLFLRDLDRRRLVVKYDNPAELKEFEWMLPVDAALNLYGITSDHFTPANHHETDEESSVLPKNWRQPEFDDDAYYEYFSDLRWSAPYENLLERISEEVFFIMFLNREALFDLNSFIARYVSEYGPVEPEYASHHDEMWHDIGKLYRSPGVLKRVSPPAWARRAVFFRDRGRCVKCGCDLSNLIDSLPNKHFDHMMPLAQGGLNDITNLQLLCGPCNLKKSDLTEDASRLYRKWYV